MMLDESSLDTLDFQKDEKKWVLEQMKPETWLEAKITKLKLPYFGLIMSRQGFLEDSNSGKMEGRKKRGGPNIAQLTP